MDAPDIDLLRRYAEDGDEGCFEELVRRHLGLVYSTALRHLGGDPHLAQDVAQIVFTHLAQSAKSLLGHRALAGWLFRDAFFVASKLVRADRRRSDREKQALMAISDSMLDQTGTKDLLPILDEIISNLRPKERDALVLRFFQGLDFQSTAERLGISQHAAEKRVERAVQRLRALLAAKGVTASSAAIGSALLAGGLASTPPILAAAISLSSLASVAVGQSSAWLTLASITIMTKLKIAAAVLLIASASVPLIVQHNSIAKLRSENLQFQEAQRQLNERLTNSLPPQASIDPGDLERFKAEHQELMRLRGEVGVRKRQIEDLKTKLVQTNRTEPKTTPDDAQREGGRYFAAENWANLGYSEPQSAAITFFWALRNGDQSGYSGAMGKVMPAPAGSWADAFKSVKGSYLSDPEKEPNGDMKVNVAHETSSGDIVNTILTYRQENGHWLIRQLAGFPIVLVEASSGSASYGIQASEPPPQ
jgi:RNA polymerase sigma factor (sigma-70 family)